MYEDGWVSAKINTFGVYTVAVDTIPPEIVPLSIKDNYTLTESNRIRFRISDELSGINKIEGYLDGKWALFEYDLKNNMITHTFDRERFDFGKRHQLQLKITDNKQNTAIYKASFWK